MKCPIMIIGRMNSNDPSDISYTDCLKEECAWWSKAGECCHVARLNINVAMIENKLTAIAKELMLLRPK